MPVDRFDENTYSDLAEMTAVAESVLSRHPRGGDGLALLGWEPGDLNDATQRQATAALFRATGRTLAVTPALGGQVASSALGLPVGDMWSMAVAVQTSRNEVNVIGPAFLTDATRVLVDLGADGLHESDRISGVTPAVTALDSDVVIHARVDRSFLRRTISPDNSIEARMRSVASGRFAVAHEILGACDAVMDLAIHHADARVQFGSPIGRFQAVQHLLAEAEVQRRVLETACLAAVRTRWLDQAAAGLDPLYLKAIAGRSGRVVMRNTLQVMGAIGFTEEHPHHRFMRRMMTVDALFGPAAELISEIGTTAIGTRQVWQSRILGW
jgi:hypothetical protein